MKKIGILGGGQLGMLLAQSIIKLGAEALIYDPDSEAPACRTVQSYTNASWYDKEALSQFFSKCDRVTYEFENVPYQCLEEIHHQTPLFPSVDVLKITQNRAKEKDFLHNHKLPHVPYITAQSPAEAKEKISVLSFPVILKSTTGGYDGKSQFFFETKEKLQDFLGLIETDKAAPFPAIVEQAIDLYMEVSCLTARSTQKQEIIFPLFQNSHRNHILDTTIIPAEVPSKKIADAICAIARRATEELDLIGLLCTEFFISRKNKNMKSAFSIDDFDIYINEFAPRPHNSGHVTMSSCTLSQFDILARILLDIPLEEPQLHAGYFCMANLLGDIWLAQGTNDGDKLNLSSIAKHPQLADLIIYGKKQARLGRKMGHLVTVDTFSAKRSLELANSLREQLKTDSCLK